MKIIQLLVLQLCVATLAMAEPQFVTSNARLESYRKLTTTQQPVHFVDAMSKDIIRELIKRAQTPVTANDILNAKEIEEVILGTKPVNRSDAFGTPDFLRIWNEAPLVGAVGDREISLAPDSGFILLKDGKVMPFDLYGKASIRIWGFQFSLKKD